MTQPTRAVLDVLMSAGPDDEVWGLLICQRADLGSGTVYPILDRLTEAGWITAREETGPHPGRPARRFYEITGEGRTAVSQALTARQSRLARFRPAGGAA